MSILSIISEPTTIFTFSESRPIMKPLNKVVKFILLDGLYHNGMMYNFHVLYMEEDTVKRYQDYFDVSKDTSGVFRGDVYGMIRNSDGSVTIW